jgi:hypothetical protein
VLDVVRLREVLHYDPDTGVFRWRVAKGSRACIGDVAGAIHNRYQTINIDGRRYFSHRLAWLYMTGAWPVGQIDHANMDRGDNRWFNLRDATRARNDANRKAHANNPTGLKGVIWRRRQTLRPWEACITIDCKPHTLGYFDAREEAYLAYATAACGVFGEFARPKWLDGLTKMRGVETANEA